jgi:surfeit locus 1 family protein
MKFFMRLFSRRWIVATLLVLLAAAVCARLGIWQLDRLAQRRTFNARVEAQIDRSALLLDSASIQDPAQLSELYNMEYRPVQVTGTYDPSQEIALQNQYFGNEWGVHLVTPLIISGTNSAVLVDRGWIPAQEYASAGNNAALPWARYNETGVVQVQGIIRRPQVKAELGSRTDPPVNSGDGFRNHWYFVNIDQLVKQSSHPLLPVYVQQAPDALHSGLPERTQPTFDLSEGPHMGYALQWFSFAVLLIVGYPFFVRRQEQRSREQRLLEQTTPENTPLPTHQEKARE